MVNSILALVVALPILALGEPPTDAQAAERGHPATWATSLAPEWMAPPEVPPTFGTISGSVSYRERIALPDSAVVQIELADISRADAAAFILASQQLVMNGRQVPVQFSLYYDLESIDDRFTYSVRARIFVSNALRWTTDTVVPVITNDVFDVELQLVPVSS
jgi:putative lipoprotein